MIHVIDVTLTAHEAGGGPKLTKVELQNGSLLTLEQKPTSLDYEAFVPLRDEYNILLAKRDKGQLTSTEEDRFFELFEQLCVQCGSAWFSWWHGNESILKEAERRRVERGKAQQ